MTIYSSFLGDGGSGGDVVGPGSSVTNDIAIFADTTGKLLADSGVQISSLLTSPLTTKGDVWGYSTVNARIPVGSDGQVLTADSAQTLGVKWATPTTGTVTSVSGTANRITSTGGSTPVIDIAATYIGQSSITTLGTITTGVWHGTAVGEIYGGTNQTSYTTGDILYASGANTLSKLAIGSSGRVLTVTAGVPAWSSASGVLGPATSTDKAIPTWNGTGGNALNDNSGWTITSATGQMVAPLGTSSAPSYSFTTHLGYGMYAASTQLGFATNGNVALTFDSSQTATVQGNLQLANSMRFGRSSNAGDINIVNTATIYGVTDTTSARAVTLPSSGSQLSSGSYFIVKDESGAAGTNNITISVSGGVKTIDGVTSYVINTNNGFWVGYYDGTNYKTVGAGTLKGTTGSTDNAILRADGTGGTTVQGSVVTIGDTGIVAAALQYQGAIGDATTPTFAFTGDTTTGIYSTGAGNINFSTSNSNQLNYGSNRLRSGTGTTGSCDISFSGAGTAGAPTYAFRADTDVGMYRIGANNLGFSTAGVLNINISGAGEVVNNLQPCFLGILGTTDSNVTGDGTNFTIGSGNAFTEIYDQNADFNTNGTLTSPVTCKWDLSGCVDVSGGTVITAATLTVVSSNRTYTILGKTNAGVTTGSNIDFGFQVDMDAADTCTIAIQTTDSGGKIDDITGNSAPITWFSGTALIT